MENNGCCVGGIAAGYALALKEKYVIEGLLKSIILDADTNKITHSLTFNGLPNGIN